MKPLSPEEERIHKLNMQKELSNQGWLCVEGYLYESPNKRTIHDLSTADLEQLDRIEQERLFLVTR